MKLEDFISKSFEHVIRGIKSAQTTAKKEGFSVFPQRTAFSQGSHVFNDRTGEPIDNIEFNLVVTPAKNPENNDEDIFVPSTLSGMSEDSVPYSPYMSRIKFSVPVRLGKKLLYSDK